MTSIIIRRHNCESQVWPVLFSQAGIITSVARGIGSSIGGSSPVYHQS